MNPVEAMKKLKERIVEFHFKDLNKKGVKESHDAFWVQGK